MTSTELVPSPHRAYLPWMPAECWGAMRPNGLSKEARRRKPLLFAEARWRCSNCGRYEGDQSAPVPIQLPMQSGVLWFTYPVRLTVDHRVPRSRGGCSHEHNLAVMCDQCNNAKGDRMPWEEPREAARPMHNRRAAMPATWTLERTKAAA